jgi:catalase (peroxidase I)
MDTQLSATAGAAPAKEQTPLTESKCPVAGGSRRHTFTNEDWWPNQLNLRLLHQHSDLSSPMD